MDLCNINQIKGLLSRHGFRFSKSMGQNFLIDPTVPRHIAAVSGAGPGYGVLEIGPGIGPLTEQLAQLADQVTAVELDQNLLPILQETMADYPNVSIVPGDILKLNLPQLVTDTFHGLTPIVCANLPYNITTPVLTVLLESGQFASITVMIQREVAKRICANPRTPDYGAFSLYCQYHAACELLFEVPPQAFLPRAESYLRSDPADTYHRAAGSSGGQAVVLPHCQGLLCHAAQDLGQRPCQRL